MRLNKFLNEAIIKPDISWVKDLIPKILSLAKKRSGPGAGNDVFHELNKIFADWFVKFDHTLKQSRNDLYAAAGIFGGYTQTKPPYVIGIELQDVSVFSSKKLLLDYWIPALYQILGHEMIHRHQLSRMQIRKKANYSSMGRIDFEKYYGDKQEIMAFAHEAMIQMLGSGLSKTEMLKLASSGLDKIDFLNLQEFLDYYGPGTPEYKLFAKYLYQYIQDLK